MCKWESQVSNLLGVWGHLWDKEVRLFKALRDVIKGEVIGGLCMHSQSSWLFMGCMFM
jgi:hypothetical protein